MYYIKEEEIWCNQFSNYIKKERYRAEDDKTSALSFFEVRKI